MDCILYEKAMNREAFHEDYAITMYSQSKQELRYVFDASFSPDCECKITTSIKRMLDLDQLMRPSASDPVCNFSSYIGSSPTHEKEERHIRTNVTEANLEGKLAWRTY